MMKLTSKRLTQTLFLSTSLVFIASTLCLGLGENESTPPSSEPIKVEPLPAKDQPKPNADEKTKISDEKDAKNEKDTAGADRPKKKHKGHPHKKAGSPATLAATSARAMIQGTLGDALTNAYQSNTEIQGQRAALRAADEGVPRALAGYKPTITADTGLNWKKDIFSGDETNGSINSSGRNRARVRSADAGLVLKQNIYRGGTDKANIEGAESTVNAERARLLTKEQEILYTAAKAYLDLYTKMAELDLLRSNANVLSKTVDSVQDKFKVGEETRTSVAQADADLADAKAKVETAMAQLEGIKATYLRVTGIMPGKIDKPRDLEMLPKDLNSAIERARNNNPLILAAVFDGDAARHNIDSVHGKLLPTVDLTGELRRTHSNQSTVYNPETTRDGIRQQTVRTRDTGQTIGIRASMPIYEAGLIRSEERQAYETSEKKRIEIETARRKVVEELTQAFQNYLGAKASVMSYRAQVTAFQVSVEGTRQEMLVGSKILLDFLNEQKKLVQAQLNLVNAEQLYYISGFQMLSALGLLNARDLGLRVKGGYYNQEAHYNEAKNHF